jgi:hypothetical protein
MEDLGLGKIIEGEQQRDAIHIAVAPVVAARRIKPGQHIGLVGGLAEPSKTPIGVADPYLTAAIIPGQRFWLFLYPNTVTGMRHHWAHPNFTAQESAGSESQEVPADAASVAFIEAFAEQAGISYEEVLAGASCYLRRGDYLCDGGRWEGFGVPDEFWKHYEIVTKTVVAENDRGSFFTCSC